MSPNDGTRWPQLLRNIDEALAQNPVLTPEQLEDVRRLRAELQDLSRSGRTDEARRCEALALDIIREGAPVSE